MKFVLLVAGVSFTVSAQVAGDFHHYVAEHLEEKMGYLFNVTARTSMGWGPASSGQVTTGPQPSKFMMPFFTAISIKKLKKR